MRSLILSATVLIACLIATTSEINAQTIAKNDTIITYYKYSQNTFLPYDLQVENIDSADYIKVIYPDADLKFYNMKEFYKNGKKKYDGKIDKYLYDNRQATRSVGYSANYYTNGRRRSVANWKDGDKIGLEYLYTPSGRLYATIKYAHDENNRTINSSYFWDFYDIQGKQTCKDGNGTWTFYDANLEIPIYTGNMKNGYMDGPWKGEMLLDDSVKYVCNFKQNQFINGIGYEKNNTAHPFKKMVEHANYSKGNYVFFVMDLNRYLKLPKDAAGKLINIDTVHFSFIVKKDGSLSELLPLNNDPLLKDALNTAVAKCGKWTSTRICGITYETKLILTLKVTQGFLVKTIGGKGTVINLPEIPDVLWN